jgi:hypothetical protein
LSLELEHRLGRDRQLAGELRLHPALHQAPAEAVDELV